YLSLADKYTNEGLIAWSEYVLNGLKVEIEKIDHIVDYSYLRDKILIPSLSDALSNKYITDVEHSILKLTVSKKTQEIQASDIKELYITKTSSEISRIIRSLIDKRMLIPISERARKYVISFGSNYLLRSVLKSLDNNGFLPLNN
ncbi:MAG: Fic family protein, partial [Paraprevotella clara]|nr:Fic family protein [Paraprevotella clara]